MPPAAIPATRSAARYNLSLGGEGTAMSNEPKKPKVEPLELNQETLANLTDEEAEGVKGGADVKGRVGIPTRGCQSYVDTCVAVSGGCATL